MSFDDFLIALIIGGIGLTAAYFRAEYVSWRRYKAAKRRQNLSLRELHVNRLRLEKDVPVRGTVQLEKSLNAKAASRVAITDEEVRVAVDRVPTSQHAAWRSGQVKLNPQSIEGHR